MPSKGQGQADSMMGTLKEKAGGLIGNEQMQGEGAAQHEQGQAQVNAAKAENRAEATGTGIKGSVKDAVGGLTGDHKMQGEGKGDKAQADVKKAANQF